MLSFKKLLKILKYLSFDRKICWDSTTFCVSSLIRRIGQESLSHLPYMHLNTSRKQYKIFFRILHVHLKMNARS